MASNIYYHLGRIFTMLGWSDWLGLAVGLLKTLKNTYSRVQYLERMSIPTPPPPKKFHLSLEY